MVPPPEGPNANNPLVHRRVHLTTTIVILPLPTGAPPTTHALPHLFSIQCGGIAARSTDFGAHLLRQTYVDCTAAFGSLTMSTVCITPGDSGTNPEPAFHRRTIDAYPPTHSAVEAVALAADAHHGTWTIPQSGPGVPDAATLHSTTGRTRAGDPVADITLNLAISRFIGDLHRALCTHGFRAASDAHPNYAGGTTSIQAPTPPPL